MEWFLRLSGHTDWSYSSVFTTYIND
uniref:Uncharacterized protein n=1 Tax=Anguilla anguilla TaxID=7936 RepID=A0A0E9VIN4_ANGAN